MLLCENCFLILVCGIADLKAECMITTAWCPLWNTFIARKAYAAWRADWFLRCLETPRFLDSILCSTRRRNSWFPKVSSYLFSNTPTKPNVIHFAWDQKQSFFHETSSVSRPWLFCFYLKQFIRTMCQKNDAPWTIKIKTFFIYLLLAGFIGGIINSLNLLISEQSTYSLIHHRFCFYDIDWLCRHNKIVLCSLL